jgi:hypothetical protein
VGGVGDRAAASGDVNAQGLARVDLLQGLTYTVEAKIWTGPKEHRTVARSGPLKLAPGKDHPALNLTLSQQSEGFR